MRELDDEFNLEKQKKEDLEKELAQVKDELEGIEQRYPMQVAELKESIEHAK